MRKVVRAQGLRENALEGHSHASLLMAQLQTLLEKGWLQSTGCLGGSLVFPHSLGKKKHPSREQANCSWWGSMLKELVH